MTAPPRKSLPLRLPADLKAWLEQAARRDGLSQNAVVVRALREAQRRAARRKTD